MIFNATSRAKVREAERAWVAKFVLRWIILIFDLIAIILAAIVPGIQGLVLWFDYIPLGVSFFWCLANIIVRFSRPRPMHPGANVGMDLVLWIAFIIALVFAYWFVLTVYTSYDYAFDYYGYGYYSYGYGYDGYDGYNGDYPDPDSPCYPFASCQDQQNALALVQQRNNIQLASLVFASICGLLHFVLFIWACVDTSRRRRGDVEARAVAIASNMVSDMERRGVFAYQQNGAAYNPQTAQVGPGVADGHHSYYGGPVPGKTSNHSNSNPAASSVGTEVPNTVSPVSPRPAHVN